MAQRNEKKLFTLEQANAMLPLVRAIVGDLVRLSQQVIDRRQRLEHLTAGRSMESGDPYDDELAQVEQELEQDSRRLREFVRELRELGVEPKAGPDGFGLVDFPSLLDGRLVLLCWQYGEDDVAHWRELDADVAERHSLALAAAPPSGDSAW
jgi:hypothetical protein